MPSAIPFYGLGPTQFPMTRAHVITVLPSLASSMKIASTGDVIGIVQQDRATTIAGTLGPGPSMIPIALTLNSERGTRKKFSIGIVKDQLFTPLLAYVAILNTLTSYERQNGVGTYTLRGAARVKNHSDVAFEDLFTGDQPSTYAAASVVAPLNVLLRNAFEDVEFEGLNLEIEASEQPRSATLERVWIDGTRAKAGSSVDLRILLRTYRGEEVTQSIPVQIPANARGSVSIMVADAPRLSQFEARELQVQPLQTTGVPQMIRVLNSARKNNRLYVRLVTRDGGAVVKGEPLAALPSSVLAVHGVGSERRQLPPLAERAPRRVGDHGRLRRDRIANPDASARRVSVKGRKSKVNQSGVYVPLAYRGCSVVRHRDPLRLDADVLGSVDRERVPPR